MIVYYTNCYAPQNSATHRTFEEALAHARSLDARCDIQKLVVHRNLPGCNPAYVDNICDLHTVAPGEEPRRINIF